MNFRGFLSDAPRGNQAVVLMDLILIAIIGCVITILSLFKGGPDLMNADTPILSVMSLQNPTLFFWGTNRFINLIPFLASPIRQPDTNLLFQILLFGGSFIGLLALLGRTIAELVFASTRRLDAWLCFAALLFTFLAISSRFAIHVFVVEGQPYGPSMLLMGLGLLGLIRSGWSRWPVVAASLVAVLLAGGLNPSLMIVSGTICIAAAIFSPAHRTRALLALPLVTFGCAVWLLIAALVPGPNFYVNFAPDAAWWNLGQSVTFLLNAYDPLGFRIGAWLALAAFVVACFRGQSGRAGSRLAILIILFALGWFLLLSQSAWVAANAWHFRYFYPVILTMVILIATPLLAWIMRAGRPTRIAATLAFLAGGVLMNLAPPRPFDEFSAFARVAENAAAARTQDIQFVAGDFWYVWPTVFLLQRDTPAFGLEDVRAIGNRDGVMRAIAALEQTPKKPRGLCLNAEPDRCLRQASLLTDRPWRASAGQCGARCTIIELVP